MTRPNLILLLALSLVLWNCNKKNEGPLAPGLVSAEVAQPSASQPANAGPTAPVAAAVASVNEINAARALRGAERLERFRGLAEQFPTQASLQCEAGFLFLQEAALEQADLFLSRGIERLTANADRDIDGKATLARCYFNLSLLREQQGDIGKAREAALLSQAERPRAATQARIETLTRLGCCENASPMLRRLAAAHICSGDESEDFEAEPPRIIPLASHENLEAFVVEEPSCTHSGGVAWFLAIAHGPSGRIVQAELVEDFEGLETHQYRQARFETTARGLSLRFEELAEVFAESFLVAENPRLESRARNHWALMCRASLIDCSLRCTNCEDSEPRTMDLLED